MIRLLAIAMVAASALRGAPVCGECHARQYASQRASHHARALRPILETPLADILPAQALRDRGGNSYRYRRVDGGIEVTVSAGSETRQMLLEWTFGDGAQGMTPVGRQGGEYVEHRLSWYRAPNRLGLTAGHPVSASDPEAALGVPQTARNIQRCFACHSTSNDQPGIDCERCHGPGDRHVAANGKARIQRTAQVQLCAQCHRAPDAEFNSDMPELEDPVSIRFAPVGFQASACFKGSKAFTCVTCHDPHADPRPASDPSYTKVCVSCHAKAHRTTGCVGCHMKKSSPLPHLTFTDHRIRVFPE